MLINRFLLIAGSVISLSVLSSCASNKPSQEIILQTEADIQEAISAEAREMAPAELRTAQQHLKKAKQAIENKEYKIARQHLEKAQVDSEYAAAKSRSVQSQNSAEQLKKSINALKDELNRS